MMRSFIWTALILTARVLAQGTVTVCESYNYTATSTFFEYETFYVSVDGRGGVRTLPYMRTSMRSTSIPTSVASSTVSNGGIGNSRTTSRLTTTTRLTTSENVPGNGTSVVIPDNTIAPTTPIPTSLKTTSSSPQSTSSISISSTLSTTFGSTQTSASTTVETSTYVSSTIETTTPTSSESTSSTSSSSTTTSTTTSSETTSSTTSTSTTTSTGAVVTNRAYIDTILRHHNQHRLNHTSPILTWNAALAATAKKIADSCVYEHDTVTDCPDAATSSCYGQNIGAGYLPTQMGFLISDGFYNSEVNYYTYYGGEPDLDTLHFWGHFSQIVWKIDTNSVGCYTTDCSAQPDKLVFPKGGGQNIRPMFTVCNYGGPGNWVDEFTENVIEPIGLPTINAGYLCPTAENCEDGSIL